MKILPARSRCPLLSLFLATLCAACSSAPPLQTLAPVSIPIPSGPPRLAKGVVQERELQAGETHEYRIAVQAGDYVRVVVEQTKMDVAVRLTAPSGQPVLEADGVGGSKEP
ncbi:MAG TPA: hypothetical protein VF414_21065, partial [Thermoanaerobaculia bacterium]